MNVGSVSPVNTTYLATIKIYYDANRLKKSVCAKEGPKHHQMEVGCFGTIAIWFIITAILINLLKFIIG